MDRRTPAFALVILVCSLPTLDGESQDKAVQPIRYDLVVTATRMETPRRELASSVTVITNEELVRTRRSSVLEALRDIVGLWVSQNGGPGATASLSIRGANNEHTLVLLDGVELNDPINPSRSYDLAHLSLNLVERVEVLRGPQSPLYGSDAMGGVINIITRKGQGRPRLALSSSGGSYGSWNGDFGLAGSSGRADYALGLSYARTAGFSAASDLYPGNTEKDGYRNLTVSGRLGLAVRRNLDLDLMVRSVFARTEIDNFGGAYGDDPTSVQHYDATLARVQARGLFLGNRWEQKLTASWTRSSRDLTNTPDAGHPLESELGTFESGMVRLDWQNNFFLSISQTLTAGADLGWERGRSDYVSDSAGSTYQSLFPSERAQAAGFYVQDQWKVRESFFVTAGTRLDIHSRTGTALTYRIAPAYVIHQTATKFRATLGTGFKSPSLYQLFAPPTAWGPIGNLGLRPERVTGWDVGVEQDLVRDRLRAGLTLFQDSFRDLIDFDTLQGYLNIGRARTRGLEVSLESRPGGPDESLTFRTSYTRLAARNEVSGALLLRRPRDKFSAELGARIFKRTDLTASVLYVGRRTDRDYSVFPYEDVELPGYVLVGAILSASVNSALDLYVRLDNILNARYEAIWGYGTPGFSLIGGFRLAL
jgi:vitamin B12 transporter